MSHNIGPMTRANWLALLPSSPTEPLCTCGSVVSQCPRCDYLRCYDCDPIGASECDAPAAVSS